MKLVVLIVTALLAIVTAVSATTNAKRGPAVSNKVFFDVSIGGVAAGVVVCFFVCGKNSNSSVSAPVIKPAGTPGGAGINP